MSQHSIGMKSYDYVTKPNQNFDDYRDKDYGVGYELPLIYLEKKLGYETHEDIYAMRHLVSHLFFLFSAVFFYLLVFGLYKNRLLAILVTLLYLLQPLIYAHSFFNSKDVPTMWVYVICFFALFKYYKRSNLIRLLLLAFVTACLLNLRLSGSVFVGAVGLFFIVQLINEGKLFKQFIHFCIYGLSTFLFLWAIWPFLWEAPVDNFMFAFENMIHFRWDGELLLFGQLLQASDLPWHYLPGWIGITNSAIFILVFCFGIIALFYQLIKRVFKKNYTTIEIFNFLFLSVLIVSFGSVFVLKPIMYDKWRQFYYLYPFMLLVFTYAIWVLFNQKKWRIVSIISMSYLILNYGISIITLFPYSQVYFSEIIHRKGENGLRTNFEMDYWGTVYKELIEHVLEIDNRDTISVWVNTPSGSNTILSIEEARKKMVTVSDNEDYAITCFRHRTRETKDYTEDDIIYKIVRKGNTIGAVFKKSK
jgi:hypothetical protein